MTKQFLLSCSIKYKNVWGILINICMILTEATVLMLNIIDLENGNYFCLKGKFYRMGTQLLHRVGLLILETSVGFLLLQPAKMWGM